MITRTSGKLDKVVRMTNKSTQIAQTKQRSKYIRDSNPYFRINPDPASDVYRIARKMYWIIGVSHFAKYRRKRAMTV